MVQQVQIAVCEGCLDVFFCFFFSPPWSSIFFLFSTSLYFLHSWCAAHWHGDRRHTSKMTSKNATSVLAKVFHFSQHPPAPPAVVFVRPGAQRRRGVSLSGCGCGQNSTLFHPILFQRAGNAIKLQIRQQGNSKKHIFNKKRLFLYRDNIYSGLFRGRGRWRNSVCFRWRWRRRRRREWAPHFLLQS